MKTKKCRKFNTKKTYKIDRKKLNEQRNKLKYFYDMPLVKKLSKEFSSRTKHEYKTIPVKLNKHKYFYEIKKNEKYGAHYLIDCNNKTICILNLNKMAANHKYFDLGNFNINSDEDIICYTIDTVGNRNYSLYYKRILENNPIKIATNVSENSLWSYHSNILYYIIPDKDLRPYKVFEYNIHTNKKQMIYHEKDHKYQISLSETSDHKYSYIYSVSRFNQDIILINSCGIQKPFKRKQHAFYSLEHRNNLWYVLEKNNGKSIIKTSRDFKQYDILPGFKHKYNIRYFILKQNYMIFSTRNKGMLYLYVYHFCNKKVKCIQFMKERHFFYFPYLYNFDFNSDTLYVKTTSFTIPRKLVKMDLSKNDYKIIHTNHFKTYKENNYHQKIVYVNKNLAITILYKNKLQKESKCILYGYGSYGVVIESEFSKYIPSLLDRGFIYCFAHVRGSKFNGYQWYKDGKMLNKKNTFIDFIDCAKYLLDNSYTLRSKLAIWGRSAGGLLIGAVINMAPELFQLAILGVPFVDLTDTMHNPCQPLTTEEYDEWGNPKNKQIDKYQRSYSPIDNINLSSNYPNVYIYSNVEDSLVPYKSVLNYYDKLKKADVFIHKRKELLLNINHAYGHGQASDRYEAMDEMAQLYSIIIKFIV